MSENMCPPELEEKIVKKILEFFVISHGAELERGEEHRAAMFFTMGRALEVLFPQYLENYAKERVMEEIENIPDPAERERIRLLLERAMKGQNVFKGVLN